MFTPPQRYFTVKPEEKPTIDSDEAKKRLFGIALSKGLKPFDAGLEVCGEDTANAVYISLNWLNDPIVIASRDIYLKTVQTDVPLLDKEQFASRLLQISEEKDEETGRYLIPAKDRLGALELYAKVMKFTDSDDTPNKTFVYNSMEVKFIEPEKKTIATIEHKPEEIQDGNIIPLKLKLVG